MARWHGPDHPGWAGISHDDEIVPLVYTYLAELEAELLASMIGTDDEIWLATDLGIVLGRVRDERGVFDLITWQHVRDVEIHADAVSIAEGNPHVTWSFTMARPAISASRAGVAGSELVRFARTAARLARALA